MNMFHFAYWMQKMYQRRWHKWKARAPETRAKLTFSCCVQSLRLTDEETEACVDRCDAASAESGSFWLGGAGTIVCHQEGHKVWGPAGLGLLAPFWLTQHKSPNPYRTQILHRKTPDNKANFLGGRKGK